MSISELLKRPDWAVAFFTLVLAAVSIFQGCMMYREVGQAERQFDEERRPWVAIDNSNDGGIAVVGPIEFTKDKSYATMRLRYTLMNTGSGPAKVKIYSGIDPTIFISPTFLIA